MYIQLNPLAFSLYRNVPTYRTTPPSRTTEHTHHDFRFHSLFIHRAARILLILPLLQVWRPSYHAMAAPVFLLLPVHHHTVIVAPFSYLHHHMNCTLRAPCNWCLVIAIVLSTIQFSYLSIVQFFLNFRMKEPEAAQWQQHRPTITDLDCLSRPSEDRTPIFI